MSASAAASTDAPPPAPRHAAPHGRDDGADRLPGAASLGLARVVHLQEVGSTMDEAHRLAEAGAPAGTLVVADAQRAGRGRGGHGWTSEPGAGLWCTLLERPVDAAAVGVLALRAGLAVAEAMAALGIPDARLKWPNDVFLGGGKVAGILIEARWQGATPEWVAIGLGVNLRVPADVPKAVAVPAGITRAALLQALVPRLRRAAMASGVLGAAERAAWRDRDLALDRVLVAPVAGIGAGIAPDGALLVRTAGPDGRGVVQAVHAGSLRFEAGAAQAPAGPPTTPEAPC